MALIYCLEDDDSIRELILYALKSEGHQAQGFESSQKFWPALAETVPQLILLDIMLPGEDGLAVLGRLRAHGRYQRVPVVMLTAKTSEYDRVTGLDAGADDYICKPFGVLELLSRVRAVLRRSGQDRKTLACGPLTMDYEKHQLLVGETPCNLTFKEFELLHYLLENQGLVLSRDRITEAVWGYDFEGESRTVDMHIKTLRQKLEQCGAPELIRTVRGVGYKIEE